MNNTKPDLILIRGLPGSGKTTMAQAIPDAVNLEADSYFYNDQGEYHFDGSKIKKAHEICQNKTRMVLGHGRSVVVSNTFTRRREMEPYFEMAREIGISPVIITAKGKWRSVHNVPEETIERMKARWEEVEAPNYGPCRKPLTLSYKNWKGETSIRRIFPLRMFWGCNEYHPDPQWLMKSIDVDKGMIRTFSVRDIKQFMRDDVVLEANHDSINTYYTTQVFGGLL